MNHLLVCATILATAGATALAATPPVFEDVDGVVVMEIESGWGRLNGWRGETKLEGYTGKGYITWRGPRLLNQPGHGTLAFRIRLSTAGTYDLRIHNRHDAADATSGNDCWTRIDRCNWIKTYSQQRGRWTWGTRHEHGSKNKSPASYELPAGLHILCISGRSPGFSIDRIHLIRRGVANGQDTTRAETRAGRATSTGKPRKTPPATARAFDPNQDFISLHYDHSPDKDDGHSAAADRTILESEFGRAWIGTHTLAVSGTYGKNARQFNPKSDIVMNAVWTPCAGWLDAHRKRDAVIKQMTAAWLRTLRAGGDVWVKEGGQSDLTADIVRAIRAAKPDIATTRRIHVVQHSNWNEKYTTDADLAYAKKFCHYIRIADCNAFLKIRGGNKPFAAAAKAHPTFGTAWRAAFAYYDPNQQLDFSDTGELMHILGLGRVKIDAFRTRWLAKNTKPPQ